MKRTNTLFGCRPRKSATTRSCRRRLQRERASQQKWQNIGRQHVQYEELQESKYVFFFCSRDKHTYRNIQHIKNCVSGLIYFPCCETFTHSSSLLVSCLWLEALPLQQPEPAPAHLSIRFVVGGLQAFAARLQIR